MRGSIPDGKETHASTITPFSRRQIMEADLTVLDFA